MTSDTIKNYGDFAMHNSNLFECLLQGIMREAYRVHSNAFHNAPSDSGYGCCEECSCSEWWPKGLRDFEIGSVFKLWIERGEADLVHILCGGREFTARNSPERELACMAAMACMTKRWLIGLINQCTIWQSTRKSGSGPDFASEVPQP